MLSQQSTPLQAGTPALVTLERGELEAWLDGYMGLALRAGNAAGAVVVVVKDGTPLLQKGYGFADVAARTPVDPARTGFRPGSVAKLFTATAVMQLVEQGKLDLDHDVNEYLDFTLPAAFGTPITLRNALTHRPGFGQMAKGLGTDDPARYESLERHVKRYIPRRIFRPGTTPAYSNYGVVLAGYIVQRISGEPFEDYLERHVFQPLGMSRSTFEQPLPERLRADMSNGYLTAAGPPRPFEILGTMPAGGLTSTGADMGRFMIAHLQDGRLDSAEILRPETARLMHRRALADFPELNGMALGFRESSRNGQRIIGHGGDTYAFHADLELYLDAKVGLFVAFNSLGSGMQSSDLIGALVDAFTDRYFPSPPLTDPPSTATATEHARMAAGRYISARHFEGSFLSLFNLLQEKLAAGDDGTITLSSERRADGQPKVWRETGPFLWQEIGGQDRLAMTVENGRVMAIQQSGNPSTGMVRVPEWMSAGWILPAIVTALAIMVLTVLSWPVTAYVRRKAAPAAGAPTGVDWAGRLTAVAVLAFVIGWAMLLQQIMNLDARLYMGGFDTRIRFLHFLGLVVAAGAVLLVGKTWRAIRVGRPWHVTLSSGLLAGAGLMIVWFAFAFGLITAGLNY